MRPMRRGIQGFATDRRPEKRWTTAHAQGRLADSGYPRLFAWRRFPSLGKLTLHRIPGIAKALGAPKVWPTNGASKPREFSSAVPAIATAIISALMNDTKRIVEARTTCDLADLSAPPSHRGAVEVVDLNLVRGWCVHAAKPDASCDLELYCDGFLLGRIRTLFERADIGELIRRPTSAGFVFHWLELSELRRQNLIAHLKGLPDGPIDLVVVVADQRIEIDGSIARPGLPRHSQLIAHLRSLVTRLSTSRIAQREAILRRESPVTATTFGPRVRAIAFYLPQFHAIPDNDEWWGKGFTEWTNVTTARPLFEGHFQPRIPSELGYYDLRTPGVIEQQIELAKAHGLSGFCFHHYWFGGKRLLEQPLERFLAIDHDFGFCLCWANEPWSRRWDGSDREVLMPQPHNLEQDVTFIHDVLPLLKDPRYICVDGKPVLIVYRVGLLSSPLQVFERWRQIAQDNGLRGLHICMAETFGGAEPLRHGCDSAVEFPPHKIRANKLSDRPAAVAKLSGEFTGAIFDYGQVVASELAAADPEYPRYKTVMLGWDNTSRRGQAANIFHGFSRSLFETWLEDACQRTERAFEGGQRLMFINAWNEWGEGTYLEPDRRYGRQLLQSVRDVLVGQNAVDAAYSVLRQRLQGDVAGLSALDRIQDQHATLRTSLKFALDQARQTPQVFSRTTLTATRPTGSLSTLSVNSGKIEQIGPRAGFREASVKAGELMYCSGWAIPGDRALNAGSSAYLKLSTNEAGERPFFGFVSNRVKREDSAKCYESNGAEPALRRAVQRRFRKFLLRKPSDSLVALPEPSAEVSSRHLWNGFSVTFLTTPLPPGRYTLSIVFPSFESEEGTAREVMLDGTLEIVA